MIGEGFRVEGFDGEAWLNLLSLFRARRAGPPRNEVAAPERRATLVAVVDDTHAPIAAFVTGRGAVRVEAAELEDPAALCERVSARRAIVLQEGAVEELTERAAQRIPLSGDYVAQWIVLLEALRELETEGLVRYFPPRSPVRLPSYAMLGRALDLILPEDRTLVCALWEDQALWTAFALHRRGADLERLVGPERLLDWTGPLGGDYRRDQRLLQRAVARSLGPVHLGIFAQRRKIEELLRDPSPGAWARAVALREVIIEPAPTYIHVAVGADAARAAGRRVRTLLGGIDPFEALAPLARAARQHIGRAGSLTAILGFDPLETLAQRLKRRDR